MGMEQMTASLLAEMKTNQANMDANLKVERRNESRPRTPERINAAQAGNQPSKDGNQSRKEWMPRKTPSKKR
jgi:hypothetical protein